jgi:hypothetical protein
MGETSTNVEGKNLEWLYKLLLLMMVSITTFEHFMTQDVSIPFRNAER